jgi:hypothetical protein
MALTRVCVCASMCYKPKRERTSFLLVGLGWSTRVDPRSRSRCNPLLMASFLALIRNDPTSAGEALRASADVGEARVRMLLNVLDPHSFNVRPLQPCLSSII